MSYIRHLADFNWLENRMIPLEHKSKPIDIHPSRLNLTTKELNQLVEKVELLAKRYSGESMLRISEKCYEYVKLRAESISDYTPPLGRCNRLFMKLYPKNNKWIEVFCTDTSLDISEAEEKILERESPVYKERGRDLSDLGIRAETLQELVKNLYQKVRRDKKPTLESTLDLMVAASLLKIEHMVRCYQRKALKLIKEPKVLFEKAAENETFLPCFEFLLQAACDQKGSWEEMCRFPIRSLRTGKPLHCPLPSTLEKFEMTECIVSGFDLEKLTELKYLRELTFIGCRFEEGALEPLSGIKNLEKLTIKGITSGIHPINKTLNPEMLRRFSQCRKLTHLSLKNVGTFSDHLFFYLSSLQLESLRLELINGFTGEGLNQLNSDFLKELAIVNCLNITLNGVKSIQRFTSLESLKLEVHSATPCLLKIIQQLPLKKLTLRHQDQELPAYKVYQHLPETIEEVDHYVQSIVKDRWRPDINIAVRGSELKRWRTQGEYPSPLEIEEGLAAASITDYFWNTVYHLFF